VYTEFHVQAVRNVTQERKFGTRLKEHKTEVESITSKPFTRNQRVSSLSEQNKSALTDHASHDNHVINWPASTILDLEPGRGQLHAEPHVRPISCQVASLSWQEPEEELNKLLLMKVSDRDQNVKLKMLVVLQLVSWSLTSLLNTNMAISETKGQGRKVIRTQ